MRHRALQAALAGAMILAGCADIIGFPDYHGGGGSSAAGGAAASASSGTASSSAASSSGAGGSTASSSSAGGAAASSSAASSSAGGGATAGSSSSGGAGGGSGAGKVRWARAFGADASAVPHGVAGDAAGDVIVVGQVTSAIDFDGQVLSGTDQDVFVAKLDPLGNHLFSLRVGGAGTQSATSVAVDATGDVVFIGTYDGSPDFGGGALPAPAAGSSSLFVVKLDALGNHLWSQGFGADILEAGGVAVGPSGEIAIVGEFDGALDFGGGPLPVAGGGDVFVAELDPNGQHLWSHAYGDPSAQVAHGVAVRGDGTVVVAGDLLGTVDFGGGPLMVAGTSPQAFYATFTGAAGAYSGAAFVAGLCSGMQSATSASAAPDDSFVIHAWSRIGSCPVAMAVAARYGSGGQAMGGAAVSGLGSASGDARLDGVGNVVLLANGTGPLTVNGVPVALEGPQSLVVTKVLGAGSPPPTSWLTELGGPGLLGGRALAIMPAGDEVIIGTFNNAVDLEGITLGAQGSVGMFVARLAP